MNSNNGDKLLNLYLTSVNTYPRFKRSRDYSWIVYSAVVGLGLILIKISLDSVLIWWQA